MITPAHAQLMSRYDSWQNRSLYNAAESLTDEARKLERGAFFGSIHRTLSHVMWGDQMWMSRFAGTPKPAAPGIAGSADILPDWAALRKTRTDFDAVIEQWAATVSHEWLASNVTWFSGSAGRDVTKPAWLLVTHMFNHQTHHRGQIHCMLTQAGAKPEDTDIPFMPAPNA